MQMSTSQVFPSINFFNCKSKPRGPLQTLLGGTFEHAQYVVECGCVSMLIQLLSSENDELKEQAVWAIKNIAGDSLKLRDCVLELGAMKHLVELMQKKCEKLTLQRNGKLC